ncbi:DUF881 domain-containing protein [Pelotomaculum sp. PtaB.Bin117]|uniref:DUF881 domain-containing protein n=1 Tax=Pelotomaculum sp. PtaB.Bin117 TaxID=1811694 RepID=UPI0009D18BAB|nr:DUF881 domain-containing protein [Pelotomaculum sp. PtaB.Bin117]OPX85627.1 MAG: hypothetical protein A4E54_02327 [Pelotomaculum sp. PtaB.Bin117]
MRLKNYQWVFALMGLVLGIMLAFQFRFTREIQRTESVQRVQELSAEVNQMRQNHEALQTQVNNLRAELDNATPLNPVLRDELEKAKVEAGVSELSGPGVEVTLSDSNINLRPGQNPNLYVLHDEDLLKVLNEINAAGAEAVSINGQRLLATTEVRCTGPTIVLNKSKRLAPPFVITAIGNPDTLENSLKMKGGVAEALQVWGIQVSVKKIAQVTVPAYSGGIKFEYAKAAG